MGEYLPILAFMMLLVGLPLWLNHTTSVREATWNMLFLDAMPRDRVPGFYSSFFAYRQGRGSATRLLKAALTIWKLPFLATIPFVAFAFGLIRMAVKDIGRALRQRRENKRNGVVKAPRAKRTQPSFFQSFRQDLHKESRSRRIEKENEDLWDKLVAGNEHKKA